MGENDPTRCSLLYLQDRLSSSSKDGSGARHGCRAKNQVKGQTSGLMSGGDRSGMACEYVSRDVCLLEAVAQ